METLALTIRLDEGLHELLIAELAEIGFDAFMEEGDELKAYGPVGAWREIEAKLMGWLRARLVEAQIKVEMLPEKNWNATWEASIEPLDVGRFVIAPTWANLGPEHAAKELLLIDPKMSFGTGYHESTRIAIRLLERIVKEGDVVLDAGTGTGILAIASLKLGARSALGFDIDTLAVESAAENATLNAVGDRFEVREGAIEVVPEAGYDVVLANMVRYRLEPLIPQLAQKLRSGGHLVLAGLLRSEKDHMMTVLHPVGLEFSDETEENEWWGCTCRKV